MKTNIWTLAFALVCLLAFTACNEKKTGANEATEENETVTETKEGSEDTAKVEIIDEEEAITENEGDADDWENEVWTYFGGTYIFFGDGDQYSVDFPLGEDEHHWATLYIRGEEFKADVNPKTGLITACDDDGKEVFRGAIYAGGNLLKGTYRGEQIKVWGPGD
jgi:hypothetical protein